MFAERVMDATVRIKQMSKKQHFKNYKRNAQILTELKYGKKKKKTAGNFMVAKIGISYIRSSQLKYNKNIPSL